MIVVFYFFAALVVLQGVASLIGGVRWWRYVRAEMRRAVDESFAPFASVFVPCRGLDQNLSGNLQALFEQRYANYEIVFVVENEHDAACAVIENLRRIYDADGARSRLIFAGDAHGCGQKIHNLLRAIDAVDKRCEVYVFVDSDACPAATWLMNLVQPLKDETIGAATGYRWFVANRKGDLSRRFASHLRSVWNASIASALGANMKGNFCWGGSTAIRRETFENLNVREAWRGAVSDDFMLTRTLNKADKGIYFVPQALTASFEDSSFNELMEFTTRQVKITRVYARHLWRIILWSNAVFAGVFFGGLLIVVKRFWSDESFSLPLSIVLLIFALGAIKSALRLRAVSEAWWRNAHLQDEISRPLTFLAHTILWTLSTILYLYNALAAWRSRRITWRGITYELKSPLKTVIISRQSLFRVQKLTAEDAREREG